MNLLPVNPHAPVLWQGTPGTPVVQQPHGMFPDPRSILSEKLLKRNHV